MSNCGKTLSSNEYVEYIFREGPFTRKNLEKEEDYCIYPVNSKWIIGSFRVKNVENFTYENLKLGYLPKLYGLCDLSANNASGILTTREQPVLNLSGQNTCVVIIDTGINWRHSTFIGRDGRSRIRALYDQENDKIYTREDITKALAEENADIPGDEIGHGTAMAGIAAGNVDREALFSGVAYRADLIVVKLMPAKQYLREIYYLKEGVTAYSEVDIMLALAWASRYVTDNVLLSSFVLGIGTSLGYHSGGSPLGDMLKDESEISGRCVTLAAGNEGNARLHYEGFVGNKENDYFELRVDNNEKGLAFEIWSSSPEVYLLEIISPSGQIVNKLPARSGKSTVINFIFENTEIEVYYLQNEAIYGQNLIAVRMNRPAAGVWRFNVYSRDIYSGKYNVWVINREFLEGNTYILTSTPEMTILNPANISQCTCVGAYNHRENSIALDGSRGYNSMGLVKPDFVAPGVDIIVPDNFSNDYVDASGSSIAAAFFSGMAALILQYGAEKTEPEYYKTSEIKNMTIAGCIRKQGLSYPNREWGYGEVNLYNTIENMRVE